MTTLNFDALYRLAVSVGFPPGSSAQTAAAIALAESGGNPQAVGDVALGGSYGLWQVFLPAHPQYNAASLTDPTYNAKAALAISNQGSNFTPWSTFNSGAYKTYLFTPPSMGSSWLLFAGILGVGALAVYALETRRFDRALARAF